MSVTIESLKMLLEAKTKALDLLVEMLEERECGNLLDDYDGKLDEAGICINCKNYLDDCSCGESSKKRAAESNDDEVEEVEPLKKKTK